MVVGCPFALGAQAELDGVAKAVSALRIQKVAILQLDGCLRTLSFGL